MIETKTGEILPARGRHDNYILEWRNETDERITKLSLWTFFLNNKINHEQKKDTASVIQAIELYKSWFLSFYNYTMVIYILNLRRSCVMGNMEHVVLFLQFLYKSKLIFK